MADDKNPSAADRTIPMWDTPTERSIEVEERQAKSRLEFDPDEPLVYWAVEAQGTVSRKPRLVRVAKFRNGMRGLQLVRGDLKNPGFSSTLTLHFAEYMMLAQCVFRDSRLIQELVSRYPAGTEPTVDMIRDFLNTKIMSDV